MVVSRSSSAIWIDIQVWNRLRNHVKGGFAYRSYQTRFSGMKESCSSIPQSIAVGSIKMAGETTPSFVPKKVTVMDLVDLVRWWEWLDKQSSICYYWENPARLNRHKKKVSFFASFSVCVPQPVHLPMQVRGMPLALNQNESEDNFAHGRDRKGSVSITQKSGTVLENCLCIRSHASSSPVLPRPFQSASSRSQSWLPKNSNTLLKRNRENMKNERWVLI